MRDVEKEGRKKKHTEHSEDEPGKETQTSRVRVRDIKIQHAAFYFQRSGRQFLTTLCSKSLPKANLKVENVAVRAQTFGRALFILREKRKAIRNAVFERHDLIWIRSNVS